MKNQTSIVFISFLIIAAGISFFIGLNIGKKSTKLVYISTPGKNDFSSSFSIKGLYAVNIIGKVKEISDKSITLQSKDGEATFNFKRDNISVLASNTNSTSSGKVKVDIFKPQKEVPLENIKIGQLVALQLLISNKEITVKTINVTSNEK